MWVHVSASMCKPDTITTCDAQHLYKQLYKDFLVFMDWTFNQPLISRQLPQLGLWDCCGKNGEQKMEINSINDWKMSFSHINQTWSF